MSKIIPVILNGDSGGTEHSIANQGKIPLVVIEVQTGDYLDEDDIVRSRDFYGRE